MSIRALFMAARGGDVTAAAELLEKAEIGDKDAEFVILEEVKNLQAQTNTDFATAFMRACEAYPVLHLVYLNANGVKI